MPLGIETRFYFLCFCYYEIIDWLYGTVKPIEKVKKVKKASKPVVIEVNECHPKLDIVLLYEKLLKIQY